MCWIIELRSSVVKATLASVTGRCGAGDLQLMQDIVAFRPVGSGLVGRFRLEGVELRGAE
jgi:hypothetical protein